MFKKLIKELKIFYYQNVVKILSLNIFKEKVCAAQVKLEKALNDEALATDKENKAFAIAKDILDLSKDTKGEEKKVLDKIQKNLNAAITFYQRKKFEAQQKSEKAKNEIKFWNLMIELKEEMMKIKKGGADCKKRRDQVAKNMAHGLV